MPPVAEAEALDLRETFATLLEGESPIQPDGTVLMHIIRPGLGRGRGRHLYEAKMLEENATKFGGWKQYVNHLSPEAKKAAGGLPRDVRDLGGRIVESWWDPNVPATDRYGQGAVVARAKPTPFMRDLIENDPEIVEASISATATGVKRGEHGGQPCWIVEGIEDRGSVDWVTEAGAGGRVVSLLEAAIEQDTNGQMAVLASMNDDEFTEYLRGERPEIAEALAPPVQPPASTESEEDTMEITPDTLQEALADESLRNVLLESLDFGPIVADTVAYHLNQQLPALIESAVEAERDVIRATARADADRRVQIERMRTAAHEMIEATRLPGPFKAEIKGRFTLTESGQPTPGLDQIDEIGADGDVVKRAEDKLTEAVKAEIQRSNELYAAANPTRVVAQGPSGSSDETPATPTAAPKGSLVESLLSESGFQDPAKVYDDSLALQG